MTQLLLVRHGRNDWVGKRLAGHAPGIHLSPEGQAEAAALARWLTDYPVHAVYSSPLERAWETAAHLAEGRGLEIRIEADLVDVDTGAWTGREIESMAEVPEWRLVQAFPTLAAVPDGEALWEMQVRVVRVAEEVRRRHAGEVAALVAHADVVKALLAHYAGLHFDHFQRLVIDTASVSVVAFTDHGPRVLAVNAGPRLVTAPAPPGVKDGA